MVSPQNPLVSVIIVNYNHREYLTEALVSLQAQTFTDFEIIVVDNASDDDSVEFVQTMFPAVRLIALNENTGFAKGNNIGIRNARGKLIALLNNDAVPDSGWLAALVAAAQRYPDVAFFASQIELYYEPGWLDSAGDSVSAAGTIFRGGHRERISDYVQERFVFGAQACAAFYRRELFDRIGGFDEDFFCVYEDADLSYRAQLQGQRCVYVPQARVRHRGGSTIGRFTKQYVYHSHRNVEYVFVKNFPSPLLWRTLPAHLLYNWMAFVFFASQGQGWVFLRAKWDALRAFPKLLAKRKKIQAARQVSIEYLRAQLHQDWVPRVLREKIGRFGS